MPDEPRPGDAGRHGASSSVPGQDSYDRPTRRRRRSMEDSGGVSVSDLVAKHGSSRSDLKPVPPPAQSPSDPPSGGHRHAQQQPTPPAREGGRRRAPEPPRSAAPAPPRAVPPQYRMQSQGTGRTRSDNDIVSGRGGRRSAEGFSPADTSQTDLPAPADPRHSRRMPKPTPPPAPRNGASRRSAQPGGAAQSSSPRVAGRPPAQQPPVQQQTPTGRAEAPRRGQPRADRLPAQPQQPSGRHPVVNQAPAPSQWDTQPSAPRVEPRSERLRPAGPAPLPPAGPPRTGRQNTGR